MRPILDSMVDTHFSGVFEDVILTSHLVTTLSLRGRYAGNLGLMSLLMTP